MVTCCASWACLSSHTVTADACAWHTVKCMRVCGMTSMLNPQCCKDFLTSVGEVLWTDTCQRCTDSMGMVLFYDNAAWGPMVCPGQCPQCDSTRLGMLCNESIGTSGIVVVKTLFVQHKAHGFKGSTYVCHRCSLVPLSWLYPNCPLHNTHSIQWDAQCVNAEEGLYAQKKLCAKNFDQVLTVLRWAVLHARKKVAALQFLAHKK